MLLIARRVQTRRLCKGFPIILAAVAQNLDQLRNRAHMRGKGEALFATA